MKRVLICGATGFIGRNLVEHYAAADGYEVHAVHHIRPPYPQEGVTWHQTDLTQSDQVDALLSQGFDLLIQAAATTSGAKDISTRPYIHICDNAVMNSLLFRAAYDHSVGHVIFFSCTLMYASSETLVREDDFDANAGFYDKYFGIGWTKVYIEKLGEFYAGLGRTRYSMLRHSNVYGPYDKYDLDRSHMFGATVTKVMTNTDGVLTVWGEGREARDLLHVDDLVRAVRLLGDKQQDPYLLVNVGLGQMVPVRDVVAAIIAASGKEIRMEHDLSKPSFDFQLALDCARIDAAVGWRPEISLDDGIRRTLDWYKRETLGT